ncbi:hypothetical protein [Bradyrhizobium sp. RDM4]|uniref:hypothetical protein n=1 Tax=Bradyrhizobium sp. RDM4 TaxID=3378765 RepID=UPI0038FD2572
MSERQAEKLLALLQRYMDDHPGASPETWSAAFVREAMTDPDLRHVPGDDVMAAFVKMIEAKRSRRAR